MVFHWTRQIYPKFYISFLIRLFLSKTQRFQNNTKTRGVSYCFALTIPVTGYGSHPRSQGRRAIAYQLAESPHVPVDFSSFFSFTFIKQLSPHFCYELGRYGFNDLLGFATYTLSSPLDFAILGSLNLWWLSVFFT